MWVQRRVKNIWGWGGGGGGGSETVVCREERVNVVFVQKALSATEKELT